ncbi:MAG: 2-succinyl-5-enolpyruvyl-6-hydroxy-3-cyclohexene-1-carboxylic-acid synthase, partial [Muribaculaceae bacterium]|nr:2-succinyl-5-enolpyruvyl-6-hydroxy-3-cyclohexene-1-carboxylic-acid synthase [Muribaculaceae bacterium]
MDTAKDVVACILDVLAGHGVKYVVCSPGSRNAPLLIAARSRKNLHKFIVVDERAAGFMALGIASVTQQPVALICTSGTALLNYAPAIAEAYYQGLPLIAVTADRPKEWIDQDDSQTLRQFEAMGNYVKGSYDVSDREKNDSGLWYVNRIANDAMLTALRPKRGPVHINLRLSPPLNALADSPSDSRFASRIIREISSEEIPDKTIIKALARQLIRKKILVTVGFHLPDATLNKALLKLRRHPNVVIMAETISNTHLPVEDYAVDSVLSSLRKGEHPHAMHPDIAISVGGALVSRMLKEYLRGCAGEGLEHWSVGANHTTVDPFQSLSMRIDADPGRFLSVLSAEMAHQKHLVEKNPDLSDTEEMEAWQNAADFGDYFSKLKMEAIKRITDYTDSREWSELVAFKIIFEKLPADYNLYLSNGTSIRYTQLLPYSLPHASYCNRGVSGIEGSTSTAAGGALTYNNRSLLITGDMSFSHDLGGLTIASRYDAPLDIIVMNNCGGGIFRFIDSTSSLPGREEYFCADPEVDIKAIAESFGFEYHRADS